MELVCDLCNTDEMMEWYKTECCGDICSLCYDGTIIYIDRYDTKVYMQNHPHNECAECYTGISDDTGNTLCRDCRKRLEPHKPI